MKKISNEVIINILKRHGSYKAEINARIRKLEAQAANLNRTVTVDAAWADRAGMQEAKKENENGKKPDLSLLLLYKAKLKEEQGEDLSQALEDLYGYIGMIDRVMCCFSALQEDERQVLDMLYFRNLKWAATGISPSRISRLRDKGLARIKELYESDCSDAQIGNLAFSGLLAKGPAGRTSVAQKEIPGQMSFF